MARELTWGKRLREAVSASGLSVHAVAKRAMVSQPALCEFMHYKHELSLASAEKVAKVLGLELMPAGHCGPRGDDER
jgi:transcriptional regulator with XRE-family HTH domain